MSGIATGDIDPSSLRFRRVAFPGSLDARDAKDFVTMTDVRNAIFREMSGTDDFSVSAAELLPQFAPSDYVTRHAWLILAGDVAVGRVGVDIPHEEDSRVAKIFVAVLPSLWGKGVGARGLRHAEQCARDKGRHVVQTWSPHVAAEGDRIEAPTGFGSVPRDHIARFLEGSGFTLEQIERNSMLDLVPSMDRILALQRDAQTAAEGYRIVHWETPTPPEHIDGYAWMKSRMSTDIPGAGTVVDEERWDAERVAHHEAKYLEAGRRLIVTAAQHTATGELCAFNELAPSTTVPDLAHQEDTLVLREHRGHRLGMLVKCAGLLALRESRPEMTRVMTYNAEENRPMLDINEAIGFAAIAYEALWRKSLR